MGLAYLALCWLTGVAAGAAGGSQAVVAMACGLGVVSARFALSALRSARPSSVVLVAFGVAAVLAGGWRYLGSDGPDVSLGRLNGGEVTMRALVAEAPDEGDSGMVYRLDVREVLAGGEWRREPGKVLMTASMAPRYEYGDLLEVKGELAEPPVFPDFNYRDYLLSRGIVSIVSYPRVEVREHGRGNVVTAALIRVRQRLDDALREVLPEPHAGLAQGVLFGAKARVPDDLRADMQTTGTSHLVAVSGQNVTIVAAFVIAALAWLIGRRPAAWLSLASIAGYAVLVGGQPSVVRAATMGAVYVLSVVTGRQNTGAFALAIAAAAMTAIEPRVIDDVSFQLSFAATLGLTTLAGPLRNRIEAGIARWPAAAFPPARAIVESAAVTVSAILFTLPITAVRFGEISLVAPAANLFMVPAFLAVALTSGVALAIDLVAPGLSGVATWIAWPAAEYMVQAVRVFAGLPGASVTLHGVTWWMAAGWYAALLAGTWRIARGPEVAVEPPPAPEPGGRRFLLPAGGIAVLIVLAGVAGWLALNQPQHGRLSVTVMDVGQGDAILIEGPLGNRVLVDGGPSSQAIERALGRNLPFDDRRIDLVAVSHPQSDHLAGLLDVVRSYDVGAVLDNPKPGDTALYDAWETELADAGLPVTTADRGQTIDLGGGASIEVLAPDAEDPLLPAYDVNEASVVLRVSMGEASFLLTGDLDANGEAQLIREGTDLRATVLKVGHHGSAGSTSQAFLARVEPAVDVISVGATNHFGHPARQTLDRLSGDVVLRTDEDGDVRIETDGARMWVR